MPSGAEAARSSCRKTARRTSSEEPLKSVKCNRGLGKNTDGRKAGAPEMNDGSIWQTESGLKHPETDETSDPYEIERENKQ